jgi:hypothetical protein
MVRGLGRTLRQSDAGALRHIIDQPRRTHQVGNLVLAPEGRRQARRF